LLADYLLSIVCLGNLQGKGGVRGKEEGLRTDVHTGIPGLKLSILGFRDRKCEREAEQKGDSGGGD